MKKLLLFVVVCVFSSCMSYEEKKANAKQKEQEKQKNFNFIKGEHPLRRFRVFDQLRDQSYSSFFLIGGSTSTSVDINRKIGFYWLSNEKQYIYTTVDMTDVRVVIDSTAQVPFIDFKWKDVGYNDYFVSVQDNIDKYLKYIVIHSKEEDFPQDIHLGDLK